MMQLIQILMLSSASLPGKPPALFKKQKIMVNKIQTANNISL